MHLFRHLFLAVLLPVLAVPGFQGLAAQVGRGPAAMYAMRLPRPDDTALPAGLWTPLPFALMR